MRIGDAGRRVGLKIGEIVIAGDIDGDAIELAFEGYTARELGLEVGECLGQLSEIRVAGRR